MSSPKRGRWHIKRCRDSDRKMLSVFWKTGEEWWEKMCYCRAFGRKW